MTTIIIMLLYEISFLMYEIELAVATYSKIKAQPLTTFFCMKWVALLSVIINNTIYCRRTQKRCAKTNAPYQHNTNIKIKYWNFVIQPILIN